MTSPPSPRWRRDPPSFGRDRLRRVPVPALLLEAWVAERRQDGAAAADAYRRALELAGASGSATTPRSPSRTRRDRARRRRSARGRGARAAGAATAEAAQATWLAAQARVQLARIAAAAGDADTAERLYREVLEWSQMQRPHQARESLFVALAGSPVTAALLGLAELAEARGDTAAADAFRARAGLALT